MSGFIDGKGDQEGETLHGFAADVFVTDSGGGRQVGDLIKIPGDQVVVYQNIWFKQEST